MQYTLRKIPPDLDRAMKERARKLGKSVNQLALETLARSVGQPAKYRSLRNMPGAWSKKEARQFDQWLTETRSIDDELWK